MDLDGLVKTAEQVVYFDVKLFGRHPAEGLSVHWHEQDRQWLVTLPGHASGVTRAELLRKFAEGALATLEQGTGENDSTVFISDHTSIQALTGVDEDGPYLLFWVWFDARHDFVGVAESGQPLYRQTAATDCVEFGLEPVNLEVLKGQFRTLLRRLDAAGPSKCEAPRSANVVTRFAKRVSDPSKARLEIACRTGDNQWLVTLHPHLTRQTTDEAIRSLADAADQVLDSGGGEQFATLLVEDGYQLDVVISSEADAYAVTAVVRSAGPNGAEYTLDLDAHFTSIGEMQLRDMVKALR